MVNKRRATFLFLLVFALCLCASGLIFGALSAQKYVYANEAPTEVSTNIVTPSTYLEYKKLNAPVDVAIDEDRFVIAENNKISAYICGAFHEYDMADYSISKIAVYGDCCMFLSVSRLYWFDFNDGVVHNTDVNVASYFSLYGDTLVTEPSNSVFRYTVSYADKQLSFTSKMTYTGLSSDARKITALDENGIYYFNEGKLINFDFISGAGEKIVENVGEIRYTASDGESIYYTNA